MEPAKKRLEKGCGLLSRWSLGTCKHLRLSHPFWISYLTLRILIHVSRSYISWVSQVTNLRPPWKRTCSLLSVEGGDHRLIPFRGSLGMGRDGF